MYVQIHDTNMYTNILTKYRARKSFMTMLFLFNTQNKIFHDRLIYLVQKRKVLQCKLYFYLLLTNSETYEPIKHHIYTYVYLQSGGGVPHLDYKADRYYFNNSSLGTVKGGPLGT